MDLSSNYPNPLDAIHKLSGQKKEELERIKIAVVKGMNLKSPNISDLQRFQQEVMAKVAWVQQYARDIDDAIKNGGAPNDRVLFNDEIRNRFAEVFECYDKDELIFILAIFFTKMTTEEIL